MRKYIGNRWLTLTVLCVGFLMILLDTTIVNVSIPTIIRDLNADLTQIEWVISGYAISFAALLITFGRLGDMYGRKNFFLLGLLVFTIASFFSGEATSIGTLIAARIFQGVGGAMLSPATLSIISSTFKGRERAIAFGVWGAIAGVAVALGPILGGIFTTYYSWRWIFRVNIPIGILGMFAAFFLIPESTAPRRQKLDLAGMVTSTLGFILLVFGLIEGQSYGWWTPAKTFSLFGTTWPSDKISIIPVTFALSAILLVVFLMIQNQKTKRNADPAVDLAFFRYLTFRYGLIAIAVIALGEFSSLFTFPIFTQSVLGYTPLKSGYAILPLALAVMIAAPLSAQLVNRLGSKWVISTGIFLEFLGILLMSRIQVDWHYSQLVLPVIILGAGIGLAISQNTQVILSEVKPEESGSASGVLNTIRQVGTALGIAIVGAVVTHSLSVYIPQNINKLTQLPEQARQQIIANASSSNSSYGGDSSAPVSAPVKQAINESLTKSIGNGMRVGAVFVFLGALLSLLIPSRRHSDTEAVPAGH